MHTIQAQRTCLCQKIAIKARKLLPHMHACHCDMCRKWSGGPMMALDAGTDVTFENPEYIQIYTSSDWAARGFCKNCGTHLFYQFKHNQEYCLPAGLFDDLKGIDFSTQIYIDKKPDYYSFSNETKNMTKAEVEAMYTPQA